MPTKDVKSYLRQKMLADSARCFNELGLATRDIGQQMKLKHQGVVRDWSSQSKPQFEVQTVIQPKFISVQVRVKGRNKRIYRYVDEGTKPHDIQSKTLGGLLKFIGGYQAKTQPIAKFAQGSGSRLGKWVSKRLIHHPGIRARKFSETFEKEILPEFRRAIENAFRRALRR